MDPIDPAFLDRAFDKSIPGLPRVERVPGVRREQPGQQGDDQQRRQRQSEEDLEEDFYEPSTPGDEADEDEILDPELTAPPDDPAPTSRADGADWVDRPAPPEGEDGPHIDISV